MLLYHLDRKYQLIERARGASVLLIQLYSCLRYVLKGRVENGYETFPQARQHCEGEGVEDQDDEGIIGGPTGIIDAKVRLPSRVKRRAIIRLNEVEELKHHRERGVEACEHHLAIEHVRAIEDCERQGGAAVQFG